jgi:hypothetical protein
MTTHSHSQLPIFRTKSKYTTKEEQDLNVMLHRINDFIGSRDNKTHI